MASSRVSSARLEGLLRHAREPVFVLSGEGRLIFVNRAWEELTGYSAERVKGLDCRQPQPAIAGEPAELAGAFCPPPEALAGKPAGGPALVLRASGERRMCRVEFWPYHNHHGNVLCFLGFVLEPNATPRVPDAESQRLRAELLQVRNRLHERHGFDALIGRGPPHQRLLEQVKAAAATHVPVLILGEPGTGKRLVARIIHQQGSRKQAPLLPFDCAALSPEVLERELFGDSLDGRAAGLRLPDGATLLVGDILDLTRDLQARLAASLDDRVRLLATTAGDPDQALRSDRLRPDLYYALTTLTIPLKPLRERLDDLPLLAQHLLERANLRTNQHHRSLSAEAIDALRAYDWPGNVRELARAVDAAHAQTQADTIGVDDLPPGIRGHLGSAYQPPPMPPPITPLDELLTQLERRLIEQALQRARQNKSRAAELLNISRPRLYRRIKELNIPDEPEPADEPNSTGWKTPVLAAAPASGANSPAGPVSS